MVVRTVAHGFDSAYRGRCGSREPARGSWTKGSMTVGKAKAGAVAKGEVDGLEKFWKPGHRDWSPAAWVQVPGPSRTTCETSGRSPNPRSVLLSVKCRRYQCQCAEWGGVRRKRHGQRLGSDSCDSWWRNSDSGMGQAAPRGFDTPWVRGPSPRAWHLRELSENTVTEHK